MIPVCSWWMRWTLGPAGRFELRLARRPYCADRRARRGIPKLASLDGTTVHSNLFFAGIFRGTALPAPGDDAAGDAARSAAIASMRAAACAIIAATRRLPAPISAANSPPGAQQPRQIGGDRAVGGEPVGAAIERQARIVVARPRAATPAISRGGDVGRIGDDDVELAVDRPAQSPTDEARRSPSPSRLALPRAVTAAPGPIRRRGRSPADIPTAAPARDSRCPCRGRENGRRVHAPADAPAPPRPVSRSPAAGRACRARTRNRGPRTRAGQRCGSAARAPARAGASGDPFASSSVIMRSGWANTSVRRQAERRRQQPPRPPARLVEPGRRQRRGDRAERRADRSGGVMPPAAFASAGGADRRRGQRVDDLVERLARRGSCRSCRASG